jgi:hypothetical protein
MDIQHSAFLFRFLLAILVLTNTVRGFGEDHGGEGGLDFLVEDDGYSSFVDPGKFDFTVFFPFNCGPLGLVINADMRVVGMEDSLAADLTGMIAVGDELLSINGERVSSKQTLGATNVAEHVSECSQPLKSCSFIFRPSVYERRNVANLHDVNISINVNKRIGVTLASDLTVREVQRGSIVESNGHILPGDKLIAINDNLVSKKTLQQVLPLLSPQKLHRVLRFRPPKEVRGRRIIHGADKISSNGKFTISFSEKGPLGMILSPTDLSVEKFAVPEEFLHNDADDDEWIGHLAAGMSTPAGQSGQILLGDRVLSVNGVNVLSQDDAYSKINVPVKSKVLRCRGGIHCGVEIVRNMPDVRNITFQAGSSRRRARLTLPADDAMIDTYIGGRKASVIHGARIGNRSLAKQNKVKSTALLPEALNAAGKTETVFYASRGIIEINDGRNGSFDFSTALFGGPLWCDKHRLHFLPFSDNGGEACEELQNEGILRNTFVVARRGNCFFSNKAIHAQYAGAAGLIVIDSKENAGTLPGRMPAAADDKHLIKIPSVMISYKDGELLAEVMRFWEGEKQLRRQHGQAQSPPQARFRLESGIPRVCQAQLQGSLAGEKAGDPVHDTAKSHAEFEYEGGVVEVIEVASGTVVSEYEFLSAKFGVPLKETISGSLVRANPPDGCGQTLNDSPKSLKGRVVLMRRGTCALVEKVKLAAANGAAAVLISNNKWGLEHMEAWEQKYRPYMMKTKFNITASSGMITKNAGVKLEVIASAAQGKYEVRLRGKSTHIEAWARLNSLLELGAWPSDPTGRGKLFLEVSRDNHPEKARPFGGTERYECLLAARKMVETHYASKKMWDKFAKEKEKEVIEKERAIR